MKSIVSRSILLRCLVILWCLVQSGSLLLTAAPTITSFTPTEGEAGAVITVRGTELTGVIAVTVGDVPAQFQEFTSTSLAVFVPQHAVTGPIAVLTTGGQAVSAQIFTFINPNAPGITGLSPTQGPTGTSVRIDGTNLTTVTAVKFNGVAASFTLNGGVLFSTVPPAATTGPVSVTTPEGTAASAVPFTVTQSSSAPTVTGFTPSSGPVGSTSVQILGTNLGAVTNVTFNGITATFFVLGNSLFATVPAAATTGLITVRSPGGTATSATPFTVTGVGAPTITGFAPARAPVGATIQIDGSNFINVQAVRFAGLNAPSFTLLGNTILVTVPPDAQTGPLTVVTAAGSATSAGIFVVDGLPVPSISEFLPASAEPGTVIEIRGANLSAASTVAFNGVPAGGFNALGGSLFVTVPAEAQSGPISVTTPGGVATSAGSFTVLEPSSGEAVITSFAPDSGPVGTVVEIRGTSLAGVTGVFFQTVSASFTNLSSTRIVATVPLLAETGRISIVTPTSTNVSAADFTVTDVVVPDPPTLTSFAPTNGVPGTEIQLSGANFTNVLSVAFNGVVAAFTNVNSELVLVRVPTNATSGPISITTLGGTALSGEAFEILHPPVVLGFDPSIGLAGTVINITGSNFIDVVEVRFGGVAAAFTNVTDQLITTVVPAGAVSGPVRVVNALGAAESGAVFQVLQPPVITGFTPASALPGGVVEITGSNFFGVTSVLFNEASALFNVLSDSVLRATVPPSARTGSIRLESDRGPAVSAQEFVVEVDPVGPPVVAGFAPASGVVGATVVISGSQFVEVAGVAFNGQAASFTVVSESELNVTIPVGATTGPITVTTPKGTATSTTSFEVLPLPQPPTLSLLRISPTALVVSWNSDRAGFVLQSSTDPGRVNGWENVEATPQFASGTTSVLIPQESGPRFFRVVFPDPAAP